MTASMDNAAATFIHSYDSHAMGPRFCSRYLFRLPVLAVERIGNRVRKNDADYRLFVQLAADTNNATLLSALRWESAQIVIVDQADAQAAVTIDAVGIVIVAPGLKPMAQGCDPFFTFHYERIGVMRFIVVTVGRNEFHQCAPK